MFISISVQTLEYVRSVRLLCLPIFLQEDIHRVYLYLRRELVLPDEIAKLVEGENRKKIYSYLKQLGFSYVTLDLGGYRMGSMNETLDIEKK